jgi:hypothetical protein
MTEFAGYIATTPVNWGKVAQEASRGIFDVLQEREEERKKLDNLSADAQREIANFERSRTRGINNTIMAGAQSGRSYIQAQNDLLKSGQITPEQYKRNVENAKVGFKTFDTFLKTVGDDLEKHRTRIDNGTASQQEIYLYNRRMGMLDLAGKSIQYGPSGSFYVKAETGELYDVSSELDPSNRFIDKVQLDSEAYNFVKTLGMTSKIDPKTGKYVTSQTIDEDTIDKGVEGILQGNADKMASVLIDNAQKYSYTDKPSEAKKDKNKILLVQDSNGVFRPQLTKDQEEEAKKYTRSVIEGKLSYKESDDRMLELKKKALDISNKRLALQFKALEQKGKPVPKPAPMIEEAILLGDESRYASLIKNAKLPFAALVGEKQGAKMMEKYKGYTVSSIRGVNQTGTGMVEIIFSDGEGNKSEVISMNPRDFGAQMSLMFTEDKALPAGVIQTQIRYDDIDAAIQARNVRGKKTMQQATEGMIGPGSSQQKGVFNPFQSGVNTSKYNKQP